MLMFPKRISPKISTFSAVAVGYLLLDDLTANEQNALGNWLMLVAQVLCTNAFYKQVMQERNLGSTNTHSYNENDTIIMMQKMMDALKKEIDELKKERSKIANDFSA